MKKRFINLALSVPLLLVMALCVTPSALATTITAGDWVTLIAHNNLSSAGIMTYAVSESEGGPVVGTYDTFCIQDNVNIWYGETFLVQDMSGIVGKDQSPQPAGAGPLVGEVDYLFSLFASGMYDDDFYNDGTNTEKKELQADFQKTLWNLQGSAPSLFTVAVGTPWAADLADYVPNVSYGTMVLNIVDSTGIGVQNQLWHNRDIVPEPATMLLLGFGLVGLAGMGRKFRI